MQDRIKSLSVRSKTGVRILQQKHKQSYEKYSVSYRFTTANTLKNRLFAICKHPV